MLHTSLADSSADEWERCEKDSTRKLEDEDVTRVDATCTD